MRDQARNRREFEDTVLEARLTAHLTKQLRPACLGAQEKRFRALVAAVVGQQMKWYAALPPS